MIAFGVRTLDRLVLGPADPGHRQRRRAAVQQCPRSRFWFLNPLAWVALAGLAGYRHVVPDSAKPQCRFIPTCSIYTSRSIMKYGVRNGTARGMLRLHRCIGFGGSGIDEP